MNESSRKAILLMMLAGILLAGCRPVPAAQTGGQLEGTITISGAWALYPMMISWGEEFQKANPGVQFDISAGGAGKGMSDALSGAVDIGMVSRDIALEEEAKGAFWVAVTKDAVFPTINAQNPVAADLLKSGVSREMFVGIYMKGDVSTWGQVLGRADVTDEIHVYTRSDSCGAAETWAKYLDGKQEDLLGIGVYGDPGLLDAVVKDPLGMGFNNLNYVFDAETGLPVQGAVVLPIDANGDGRVDADELLETKADAVQAVASGTYPSPPARALNLVTQGKPSGLVHAFMLWILADGQKYVDEVGYIELLPEQIQQGRDKLE
ncbi:MAG: substrate-binding domain-containing protein [Thermoflexales bacterium]|nr:substrate-binding domain-containing protein [Thermoflexales bacterium]